MRRLYFFLFLVTSYQAQAQTDSTLKAALSKAFPASATADGRWVFDTAAANTHKVECPLVNTVLPNYTFYSATLTNYLGNRVTVATCLVLYDNTPHGRLWEANSTRVQLVPPLWYGGFDRWFFCYYFMDHRFGTIDAAVKTLAATYMLMATGSAYKFVNTAVSADSLSYDIIDTTHGSYHNTTGGIQYSQKAVWRKVVLTLRDWVRITKCVVRNPALPGDEEVYMAGYSSADPDNTAMTYSFFPHYYSETKEIRQDTAVKMQANETVMVLTPRIRVVKNKPSTFPAAWMELQRMNAYAESDTLAARYKLTMLTARPARNNATEGDLYKNYMDVTRRYFLPSASKLCTPVLPGAARWLDTTEYKLYHNEEREFGDLDTSIIQAVTTSLSGNEKPGLYVWTDILAIELPSKYSYLMVQTFIFNGSGHGIYYSCKQQYVPQISGNKMLIHQSLGGFN